MADSLSMMPWFPRDFLASTRGWSITAAGVYRTLLDAQWDLGGLPADPEELRCLIGATVKEWSAGWKKCACKFPLVNGARLNEKLEDHRTKAFEQRERHRRGARSTNAKRWSSDIAERSVSDSLSDGIASQSAVAERVAERSPPSPSEEKIQNKTAAERPISTDFETESEDPDDFLIWKSGVQLIGESNRSLMGKLVKIHGRDVVARKLGELMAMTERPRDPAAYFIGALRKLERRFQP